MVNITDKHQIYYKWFCSICHNVYDMGTYKHLSSIYFYDSPRYRCADGCDFDYCEKCLDNSGTEISNCPVQRKIIKESAKTKVPKHNHSMEFISTNTKQCHFCGKKVNNYYICKECESWDNVSICKPYLYCVTCFQESVSVDINKDGIRCFQESASVDINRDGIRCLQGQDGSHYYCGRKVRSGSCPCGNNCDDFCGPNNGCPCKACLEYYMNNRNALKHKHPMFKVVTDERVKFWEPPKFFPKYDTWFCDNCGLSYKDVKINGERYHCSRSCSFDLCGKCFRKSEVHEYMGFN